MKLSMWAAAALCFFAPAAVQAATPITFNGVCANTATATQAACTGLSGAYGNSATLKATNDATLSVLVTAWQAKQTSSVSTNTISSAFLGAYGGGFGVTGVQDVDANNAAGGGGTHQIDNVNGYTDFVMLQFSRDVHLEGLNLNMYGVTGATGNHDDYSVYNLGMIYPSLVPATWNGTLGLANYTVDPSTWANVTGGTANGYVGANASSGNVANGSGFSKVWLVSASQLASGRDDGFKLASIMVTPQLTAVPEPATWGMMILGFGAIGASLRRRRASGAPRLA